MSSQSKKYKILFSGGGTGGSVTPLLAVAEELTSPQPSSRVKHGAGFSKGEGVPLLTKEGIKGRFEFLWLGTKKGIEREMVEQAGIKFKAIAAGKLRRYFSFKNFWDIFKIFFGFCQSFYIMLKWQPDLIMSAGAFVSVPVVWAAWLLRVPIIIHQQDIRSGLANKLMAPFAKVITVTFEKSLKDYGERAVWTGNPVRKELRITNYKLRLKMPKNLPIVLILGGGTGAKAINEIVGQSLNELVKFCQIIHVTGKNKLSSVMLEGALATDSISLTRDSIAPCSRSRMTNYTVHEFLESGKMAEAMKLADIVVTRAGMSALTELSCLAKPAIIIPLPDSHQEENAATFKDAAIVLEQKSLTAEKFIQEIKILIENENKRKVLSEKIEKIIKKGAEKEIANIIIKMK